MVILEVHKVEDKGYWIFDIGILGYFFEAVPVLILQFLQQKQLACKTSFQAADNCPVLYGKSQRINGLAAGSSLKTLGKLPAV